MTNPTDKLRKPHRGLGKNLQKFPRAFVKGRIGGFAKDMRICLKGMQVRKSNRRVFTHAYFPALMSCCGMLEYLAGLHCGSTKSLGWRDIHTYAAKYLSQPAYNEDAIRVLWDAFRNAIAHRGIASGVWGDHNPATRGRRLTWKVYAKAARPALNVVSSEGVLKMDPPWECRYTHRVHIYLRQLLRDICESADHYLADLAESKKLQDEFYACMQQLYPR